ncbi:alanine racemase [Jannaschia sp. CCS1]|uniref:Alanine racemase n=1 Tax=Jannaschia sp. (strain CCS1) TaxID=290400 RepID=ALR_JANSC|nr:alanine racemase [Jannaschia sp. CCS1]Q28RK6.1 RecName: Full=Alanine racemase [Jannaschia sp. CCS1]ABD54656.1 alanine racemase [Jannaschia sp. CCS1]
MATGTLTVDLGALVANYRTLDRLGPGATAAVVKADGYGLGAGLVSTGLAKAGACQFFVATAEEGVGLRQVLGPAPEINVFAGHMAGDTPLIRDAHLTPMLNSPKQVQRHRHVLPGHPYGIQLDTGMHRLGVQPADWPALRDQLHDATLLMSHLACADAPDHPQNAAQLAQFRALTDGIQTPRSLAATGGTLMGPDYHFDLIRPGVGLYGGLPFAGARPVVRLSLPVIQIRCVNPGATIGYGATYTATTPRQIATLSAGYADGLIRALSSKATLWDGDTPCPLVGRVSMDLLTVDVTDCDTPPEALDILGPHQTIDQLAEAAGTIGYEILTSLGPRYRRALTP